MKKFLACVAVAVISGLISMPASAVVYDFESLSAAAIAGQDNWTSYLGAAQVVTPSGAGNPSTRVFTASGAANIESFGSRINDGNFSIPTFTGSETATVLQFDLRLATTGNSQATMGVGRDIDSDGSIEASVISGSFEVNPVFGADVIGGVPHFMLTTNGGGTLTGYVAFPTGFTAADWIRVRLDMDLTANSGDGSGSVSAQNLTTAGAMTPITGLQNLNLNLTTGGQAPSLWNGIYAESYGGDANGGESDNFTVLVPEPASAVLLAEGAGLLARSRRRA